MKKCPKCGVGLGRSEWEAGTCEVCGWERKRETRLADRKRETRTILAKKTGLSATTIADRPTDPKVQEFAGYAKRLTRLFIELWDQDGNACENPVILRNRNASTHQRYDSGHQIAFSWYSIQDFADGRGFSWVNKSLRHLHRIGATGREAVYELAIHEFAHWLQVERGGRTYGSQHNGSWAEAVREIRDLAPFSEVSGL